MSFENVRSVVKEIANKNGFVKYHINVKEDTFTGQNYTSKIVRAQIVDDEDKRDQVNLFIKLPLILGEQSNIIKGVFVAESNAYCEILPRLLNYQREHQIPLEKHLVYPKVYKADVESEIEHIIFKDVSYEGYSMLKKATLLNYDHAKEILTNLADYHSISLAIRFKDSELFEKLTKNMLKHSDHGNMMEKMILNITSKVFPQLKSKEKVAVLKEFIKDCGKKLTRCYDSTLTEPFNVICHGDFHINNLMFRYKNNKPEVLFVDWQAFRYASPVVDIMTLIYMPTDRLFRDKNLKKLYELYYNTLEENLQLYGCDIHKIYPRSVFQEQLKNVLYIGHLFGIIGATMHFRDPGEDTDLKTMLGDGSDFTITVNDEMKKRLEDLADDMVQKN